MGWKGHFKEVRYGFVNIVHRGRVNREVQTVN